MDIYFVNRSQISLFVFYPFKTENRELLLELFKNSLYCSLVWDLEIFIFNVQIWLIFSGY